MTWKRTDDGVELWRESVRATGLTYDVKAQAVVSGTLIHAGHSFSLNFYRILIVLVLTAPIGLPGCKELLRPSIASRLISMATLIILITRPWNKLINSLRIVLTLKIGLKKMLLIHRCPFLQVWRSFRLTNAFLQLINSVSFPAVLGESWRSQ